MPFFPQSHVYPEVSLFDLLGALDQPQGKSCVRSQKPQTFTPRFDVTETADAYELHGEVPGLDQQDLSIEFSDAQTLLIKGKTERRAAPINAPAVDAAQATPDDSASEKHTLNATVEDEYDQADAPLDSPATSPATAAPEKEAATEKRPTPKYWVAERRVGAFARSFSFSQRIEQDAVQADLKNGILHVAVPKSQKSKKISVSVN